MKIYPVFIESQTEVLANHFYQAGDFHKAIGLWTLATETCLANSAFDEARLCIERGRESIQKILKEDPLNKNYQIEELKLFNLLMSYHIATDGWCAREIQPIYLEICKRFPTIPDPLIELQILYKKRSYELFNGEMSEQINLAHKQLQLAEKTNDKKMLTVAYSSLAAAYSFALQPKAAIKFSELVKGSYNKENQSWYRVATSTDPYVISQIHAIFSIWALGKVETAEKYSLELMRFTEGKTVPFTRATSQIWNYGYLLYLKADFGNLADFATHCREYCQKQNIRQLAAYSQCLEGYSIAMTGNAHIGLEIFKVGFTNWTNLGIKMGTGFLASLLGGILAEMKLVQEGLELVLKWEIHVQNGNEPFYAIPYFLNLGKLFVRSKNLFQAKIQFQQALKLADDAEALTWSLKAILALADLEQSSQVKLENLGKFFQRVRSEEELRKSKDGILLESLMKKLT